MIDTLQENISFQNLSIGNGNGHSNVKQLNDEIEELNQQSKHMQYLIEQVDALPESKEKELMQDCIAEIITFYGKGLERILNILMNENSDAATKILNDLMEDSFISGLLLIHDLHPLNLQTRLNFALEKVRPYIHSHGGSVDIISLENGVAKIRMSGSCKSCASSSVTLELAIKQAIEDNCPDLIDLIVEGIAPAQPKNNHTEKTTQSSTPGWKIISGVNNLHNGETKFLDVNSVPVIICKVNNELFAYRNSCPACEMPLSTGTLEDIIISCRLGHRFDVQHAGVCVDDADLHLDPFPLLNENRNIKIAVK